MSKQYREVFQLLGEQHPTFQEEPHEQPWPTVCVSIAIGDHRPQEISSAGIASAR